jgi:hypothetical protein
VRVISGIAVLVVGCALDRTGVPFPEEVRDAGCPEGLVDPNGDGTCVQECERTGPEVCDGVDNDCAPETPDGSEDERVGSACDGPDDDLCTEGAWRCVSGEAVCEDFTDNTRETCSPDDEDCDGRFDESGGGGDGDPMLEMTAYYPDLDGDGHGDATAAPVFACVDPPGMSRTADDCNDMSPVIYSGAVEACNGADENCNDVIDDGPGCECPRVTLGHRIFAFCNPRRNFDDARSHCESISMRLASIHTGEENARVLAHIARSGTSDWWIGARQADFEGSWSWIDGTPFDYPGFSGGEPNGWVFENCADIDEGAGHWRDVACALTKPMVCASP